MESTEYSLPEIVYSLNAMATNLGTHKNASVLKHAAILLTMQSERIKELEEDSQTKTTSASKWKTPYLNAVKHWPQSPMN